MNKLALVFAAASFFAPAFAQELDWDPLPIPASEELQPEAAALSSDDSFVITQLLLQKLDLYRLHLQLGMLAQSGQAAPQVDFAVGLKRGENAPYAIAAKVLSEPLQKRYSLSDVRAATFGTLDFPFDEFNVDVNARILKKILRTAGERTRDLKVTQCEVPLASAQAERLMRLWQTMLLRTTYYWPDDKDSMQNYTDYHFWGPYPCNRNLLCTETTLRGRTLSPPVDKRSGALVAMGEAMRDYCFSKDKKDLVRLDGAMSALERKLPKSADGEE